MVSSHLGAVAVSLFSCLLLTANNVVNALPGGGPVDDTPKKPSLPVTLPSTKTSTAIAGPTSSPLPPLFFGAIAVLTPTANSTVRGTVIFQQLPWANNRLTVANNPISPLKSI
ncbi:hypothetical protein BC829DRAFT_263595 [Chytridium lagenaria]|nr:hypothetical protein BC829DRAFT_263595 [Chytridium lagenaria]